MSAQVEFDFDLKDQAMLTRRLRRLLFGLAGMPGFPLIFVPAIIALMVGAIVLTSTLPLSGAALALANWLPFVIGGSALLAYGVFMRRRSRNVTQLDTLQGQTFTFEANEKGIVWSGGGSRFEADWSIVDLLDVGPQAVMLVVRCHGYFAPNEAFPDEAARRTFIDACVAHMTPEARARSRLSP